MTARTNPTFDAFADAQARLDEGDYAPGPARAAKRTADIELTQAYDAAVLQPAADQFQAQLDALVAEAGVPPVRRPVPAPQPAGRHRARNFEETQAIRHPKGSIATRRERLAHRIRAWFRARAHRSAS